jgi:hypothetical protein
MQAFTFNSLANATLAQQAIDAAMGCYPCPGQPLDSTAVATSTTTYGAILRNAAGTAWAYVADTFTSRPLVTVHAATAIPTDIETGPGGNWAGAVQVWP